MLGGLVTVVAGAEYVLSLIGRRNTPSVEIVTSSMVYAVLVIALGLVGIFGSRQVKNVGWDIVLIVVGLVAYQFAGGFPWLFGPVLMAIAGIVGIVAKLA